MVKRKTKQKKTGKPRRPRKTTALPAVIYPAVVDYECVVHLWSDSEDMAAYAAEEMARIIETRWHRDNLADAQGSEDE